MIKKRKEQEKKRIRKKRRELKIIKNDTDGELRVVVKNGNGKNSNKGKKSDK